MSEIKIVRNCLQVMYTVVSISVSGVLRRFRVHDRRKRIEKYALSLENAFVWTGENETRTLVFMWYKILCFVLVEAKTDTFENP